MPLAWKVMLATDFGLRVLNEDVFSTAAPVLSSIAAVTLYVLPYASVPVDFQVPSSCTEPSTVVVPATTLTDRSLPPSRLTTIGSVGRTPVLPAAGLTVSAIGSADGTEAECQAPATGLVGAVLAPLARPAAASPAAAMPAAAPTAPMMIFRR